MIYLKLFYEFAKIGLFAVGGGLAAIPFLSELAEKTGWYTISELADMIAISESTPGPIGINMATFTGYKIAGTLGALVSTLGLIVPSLILMILIAKLLTNFQENKIVNSVFFGLRPASVALIAAAGIEVAKISLVSLEALTSGGGITEIFMFKPIILAAVLFFLIKKFKLHLVASIAISAVVGIIFNFAS